LPEIQLLIPLYLASKPGEKLKPEKMKLTGPPFRTIITISVLSLSVMCEAQSLPHLTKKGSAIQLIVNDRPFLVLGGESGNSSASDVKYMEGVWPKITEMKLNTLLTPVYWEIIEPKEGTFDFSLIDSIITNARKNNIKLILLWFGSWKNSMSCYAPAWIKTNQARFPRAKCKTGASIEMMSPFYDENMQADMKAYGNLMRHLAVFDKKENTVIMMQVENEIGMIPDARDYSDKATEALNKPVPERLIDYMTKNKENLRPELYHLWKTSNFKSSGNWEEVFGKSLATDEVFMAWHYASYVEKVTISGKSEYNIPAYVNAALIRKGYQPGQYPSAGPLPHLMDIWRAGAPSIDFLSPDIYFPNFEEWCWKYQQTGNPLFIPEAKREPEAAMRAFYAIGAHDGIGFSPFAIEQANDAKNEPIGKAYGILSQLAPLILENQGKNQVTGFTLDQNKKETETELGGYILHIKHIFTLNYSPSARDTVWQMTGGIIICTGPGKYIIAGSGFVVTFEPAHKDGSIAGILSADQGTFVNGIWKQGRRMNGDEDHQGRHIRIFEENFEIQKVELYSFK
jgi:hypothetical protein